MDSLLDNNILASRKMNKGNNRMIAKEMWQLVEVIEARDNS